MLSKISESLYWFKGLEVLMVKYLDITVELGGKDGNAFNILGICRRAMKRAHLPESEIEAFRQEATSSNYDHLLATVCEYFNVE